MRGGARESGPGCEGGAQGESCTRGARRAQAGARGGPRAVPRWEAARAARPLFHEGRGSAADEGASQLRSFETGAAGGVDVGSASGVDVGAALAAFAAFSLSFFFVATAFLAAALATAKNAFSDG